MQFADGERIAGRRRGVRRPASARATSWPARPAWRSASAGESSPTRAARPATRSIFAIGEVAHIAGRVLGPGRPGLHDGRGRRRPTARAAPRPSRAPTCRPSSSCWASTSPASAMRSPPRTGSLEVVYADPVAGVYKKLVMSDDAQTLLGGMLVGDASAYAKLRPMVGRALGSDPTAWLLPEGMAPPSGGRRCRTTRPSARATTSRPARSAAPSPTRLHRPRRRSRPAPRPAPAAARASPLVKKLVDDRAGRGGRRGQQRAVRALRLHPGAAVRHRPGQRDLDVQRAHRAARHAAAAATSAARSPPRSWRRSATGTCSTASTRRCRTPTTTSWPTCRRTAPTRSSRASPAARSRPTG